MEILKIIGLSLGSIIVLFILTKIVGQRELSGLSIFDFMIAITLARTDYTTFDILKEYYQDEEEDMYWGEQQLELVEVIGKQNWILKQM